ncbi:MAG: hypothetical protein ACRCS8_03475 [Brevinema sp.]
MKYLSLLSVLLTSVSFAVANNSVTQTYFDKEKSITEVFKHTVNGFIYEYSTPKKKMHYIVETNVNSATLGFTNIIEDTTTNEFYIMSGKIFTPVKTIDIGFMEIVLFPEIQLQNFATNTNLMEITYKGINAENNDIETLVAKKIVLEDGDSNKSNNIIPIEMTIENVPSSGFRLMYYYNQDGIAVKKEGFFGLGKKPKFSLILEEKTKK